ncbi:MAG TPA: PilX N-terminal domain-containing pilus assembly protein [candidate division Zixibacteria bacterium]|nr:hypothetical protein [candidate division Zixibacteria bacterium]MDD4918245.1 PilX N-terminal domain-containing pilus assembly protein [candidate division Zixibacteria bacterium]MDM7973986.1 PilX N-terminal domain-containing pilus assembly protein [candidate division Zixibacteria bacterium]HOD66523.1 PilX N-terminal domain-containing pilus assembly protein [candidate division Zixibacteria bacterium]HPM38420.1 PilX N-terminal domain-containing pilus assembly protein [candidate division Zixibac
MTTRLPTTAGHRGFATFIALILVVMLTLLGIAALSTSDDEMKIAGNELHEMKAFYAAEAGLADAAAAMRYEYDSTGLPPAVLPSGTSNLNNCLVTFTTADDGAASPRILTSGTLAGLHALVKSFTITSEAENLQDGAKVTLSQSFEVALVPLFQFAVFYDNDLEIAPGPEMNLIGRVHSNGNMYLQSNNTLRMNSYVTAAGDIRHGRKGPGSAGYGDVQIKSASGAFVSMKQGSGWLDAGDPQWYDSSVGRWQGRVQDAAHGQESLNLPLSQEAGGDPHRLIERAAGNVDSYENKATLKFIDGRAFQRVGGIWTDITADMTSRNIISSSDDKFYDQREKKWVDPMELDLGKLYDEGYGPANGVIYFSDQTSDFPALRIKNADELDGGLSVVSENPMYVVGNYNATDKKPAALIADAITFLSSAWDDSKSTLSKTQRVATTTVVNACYATGNVETTSSDYSGGFENLPRFLETWNGKTLRWKGSAVNLWASRQATGTWNGTYYDPPNRDWLYDTDLDDPYKLPPETPMIRVFQRSGWKQEHVGYADADF